MKYCIIFLPILMSQKNTFIHYKFLRVSLFFNIIRNAPRDFFWFSKCFPNIVTVGIINGKLSGRGNGKCLHRLALEKWRKKESLYQYSAKRGSEVHGLVVLYRARSHVLLSRKSVSLFRLRGFFRISIDFQQKEVLRAIGLRYELGWFGGSRRKFSP